MSYVIYYIYIYIYTIGPPVGVSENNFKKEKRRTGVTGKSGELKIFYIT